MGYITAFTHRIRSVAIVYNCIQCIKHRNELYPQPLREHYSISAAGTRES